MTGVLLRVGNAPWFICDTYIAGKLSESAPRRYFGLIRVTQT